MQALTLGRAGGWTLSLAPIVRRLRSHRAARHLMGLDDHMLTDIGLTRDDIATAVEDGRI
jgi:uncharacterized protein YjiS (DUF1127 family)